MPFFDMIDSRNWFLDSAVLPSHLRLPAGARWLHVVVSGTGRIVFAWLTADCTAQTAINTLGAALDARTQTGIPLPSTLVTDRSVAVTSREFASYVLARGLCLQRLHPTAVHQVTERVLDRFCTVVLPEALPLAADTRELNRRLVGAIISAETLASAV
jgi:hypothetical protein